MKMNKFVLYFLLALFAATLSSADTSKYYIGVSLLSSETEFDGRTDGDSGLEARFGYLLSDYFSLEVGYLDLGLAEFPDIPDSGGSFETDGYEVLVVGTYPINDFSIIGKLGNYWWESDGVLGSIAGPVNYSNDGSDLILGIGLSYRVTDTVDIKIEYNESHDFNWSSLGVNYRF